MAVEHVGDAVLPPGDPVHLDPRPKPGRARELEVLAHVVHRVLAPEGVIPDLERLGEAVDVLGDAELADPAASAASR